MRLSGVVYLLFCLAGCSQQAADPAAKPDLSIEERAIREMDARWLKAAQSRDAGGEAAMFASDGVAYREHVEPLVGPAAIQAWDAKLLADNPKQTETWTTDSIQFADSGNMAIQTGQYHITGIGANGDGEDRGHFVTIWKKVGGEWKVAHDIGSTTMPVRTPEKKQ
jgi:uncharacterized protein (TIGR02246 family)